MRNTCLVIYLVILIYGCKVVKNEAAGVVTAKSFRITNQISPWIETSYSTYDSKNLYDEINGEAPKYINNGLIEGILQRMSAGVNREYEGFVMDFGTKENAAEMFISIKSERNNWRQIGNYSEDMAIVDVSNPNEAFVIAYFGKFFFQMLFIEKQNQPQAIADAELFLAYYEATAKR